MLPDTSRFRFDETQVISEVIEGEIVVVHFQSGCYYSIRGTGADVCRLLTVGRTVDEVVADLAAKHGLPSQQIATEVQQFVDRLVAERLLAASGQEPQNPARLEILSAAYAPPEFEKFDDMADQLLLDPIHEIGSEGWPVRPAA